MKRLLIIIFAIILCVLISVSFGIIADEKAHELDGRLREVFLLAEEENPNLYKKTLETEKFWEKNEIFFIMVANHTLTDELDADILMLKHYAEINEEHEILAKVSECRSILKEISKYDRLAMINVF